MLSGWPFPCHQFCTFGLPEAAGENPHTISLDIAIMSTLSNGPGFAIVPLPLLVTVVENLIICWWLYCVGYTFPAFVMESRIAWASLPVPTRMRTTDRRWRCYRSSVRSKGFSMNQRWLLSLSNCCLSSTVNSVLKLSIVTILRSFNGVGLRANTLNLVMLSFSR